MIHTSSLIDGFKVILGSMPLQLGMFLTVIFKVPVPEIDGQWDTAALAYKIYLVLVHGLLFCQISVNHYYAHDIPMLSSVTNVVFMCMQVVTQINISINWIFLSEEHQEWLELRQSEEWVKFMKWCYIEIIVFIGYLLSATIFNVFLFFFRPVADLVNPATGESPESDILEA